VRAAQPATGGATHATDDEIENPLLTPETRAESCIDVLKPETKGFATEDSVFILNVPSRTTMRRATEQWQRNGNPRGNAVLILQRASRRNFAAQVRAIFPPYASVQTKYSMIG
jgi:hypothetical protein